MTTYPLGKPPHLPDYIKNNRFIIGLEKDRNNNYPYKDHLCFFRCLAIGKYKFTRHNCNQKAKELFDQYCEHFEVNPQDFKGVELTDFPQLEKYYETRLFAMFLKEDGTAKTLYLSQSSFPTKIYMNVYQNHLSFITDIKMYSKQYICVSCDKLFSEMQSLNKHQPIYQYTKINCLCLRNWRKWVLLYMRRTNMKSSLRAMILRHISVIFVKALTRLRNWIRRKVRLGIKCMFQYHLVWGVIWKGWKRYMSLVKILRN